ncbi:MAG: hypothetical protein U1D55_09510 [Phycisphaerae bacterium]
MLVVIGVIALLVAVLLPPMQMARRQAIRTKCGAQLQQIGRALEQARTEFRFYPYWDDGGVPVRFSWMDALVERQYIAYSASGLSSAGGANSEIARVGYCPSDQLPDLLNEARNSNLLYPLNPTRHGVDYSYGIGAPLSAGGWLWRNTDPNDDRSRRFRDYESRPANRVLAGDSYSNVIYNLSGRALRSGAWNDPTQFDNTVSWERHVVGGRCSANLLFQDGHVASPRYELEREMPVNTATNFVWQPGEAINVGPQSVIDGNWYPNVLPPNFLSSPPGDVFPREMMPAWYTLVEGWTQIKHKTPHMD